MALTFLFNGKINHDISKYITSYVYLNKIHYYPCCYIDWIQAIVDGKKLSSIVQQYKMTIENRGEIIFHGEIYDLSENYQDFTSFYRPGFHSVKQIYDIFDENQLFMYKYNTNYSEYSYFKGEELASGKIKWDQKEIINNPSKIISIDQTMYQEIRKNIPTNLNVIINSSYHSFLPLKISTSHYFPFIFCKPQEDLEELIEEELSKHNDSNIYMESFCLIPQNQEEEGQDQEKDKIKKYYINIDYINTAKCHFQEMVTINMEEAHVKISKDVVINQKLCQIQLKTTRLNPTISIESSMNKKQINEFLKTYLKKREFNHSAKIIVNMDNIHLNVGDSVRFHQDKSEYYGILNQVKIQSLNEFPQKVFAVLDCYCFPLEENSALIMEESNKVEKFIDRIQYPKLCKIDLSKVYNNWKTKFQVNTSHNGQMQIKLPKLSYIGEKFTTSTIKVDLSLLN